MIKSEAAEELLVACVRVDHAHLSAAQFTQVQRRPGQGAQKGAVHDRTALQVHHEMAPPTLDHRLKAALHLHAVLKRALPFYAHPKEVSDLSNENGSGEGHGGREAKGSGGGKITSLAAFAGALLALQYGTGDG